MSIGKKIHYAWVILFGICILRGFTGGGIASSGGLFLKPVADELGVGIGRLSLYLSIASIATMISLPIMGKLIERYDIRTLTIVAGILNAGSFITLGWMHSVWGWYLLSIPMAIGASLLNGLLGPILINNWFKEKKGTAMGIMMACVGVTGAILQPLVGWLIANRGWRAGYWILGGVTLGVIFLVALLILRKSPLELGMKAYGAEELIDGEEFTEQDKGLTVQEALKSSSLYLFILFLIMGSGFSSFSQHVPTLGLELGYSVELSSFALSTWMIGAVIGALIIGRINDRLGVMKATIVVLSMGAISLVGYLLADKGMAFYLLGNFANGFSSVMVTVIPPILTSTLFGNREYGKIYSFAVMGVAFAAIIFIPVYGYIYDYTGSYRLAIGLMAIILAIAVVSVWGTYKRRPTY